MKHPETTGDEGKRREKPRRASIKTLGYNNNLHNIETLGYNTRNFFKKKLKFFPGYQFLNFERF